MPEALAKGLRNVLMDETQASFIDGEQGILLYRGYSIHDLAVNCSFEEVAYLLLYGSLPNRSELDAFEDAPPRRTGAAKPRRRHHPHRRGQPPDGRPAHRRLGAL